MNAIASSSRLIARLSCTCRPLLSPSKRNFTSSISSLAPFPSLSPRQSVRHASSLMIRDAGRDGKGKGRTREDALRIDLERTVQAGLLGGHPVGGSGGLTMRCTTLNREGSFENPFVLPDFAC